MESHGCNKKVLDCFLSLLLIAARCWTNTRRTTNRYKCETSNTSPRVTCHIVLLPNFRLQKSKCSQKRRFLDSTSELIGCNFPTCWGMVYIPLLLGLVRWDFLIYTLLFGHFFQFNVSIHVPTFLVPVLSTRRIPTDSFYSTLICMCSSRVS